MCGASKIIGLTNLNMNFRVLAEKDVYKQLLEKQTGKGLKYSALTKWTNILFVTDNIKRCVLIRVWSIMMLYFLQEKCTLGTLHITTGVGLVLYIYISKSNMRTSLMGLV